MSCGCGKPKCDGHCGASPAVLQINNPSECTLFHRVEVPASMGDSKTNPPKNGEYNNVLLYYEADQTSWLYSSDGIPQKLVNGLTNYEDAINLPQINGHTLLGNQSSSDLGLQGELTAGANIQINDNVISATNTTYTAGNGIELDDTEIKAKIGDGLEFSNNGEINIANIEQYAHFFDTVADMKASTLNVGDYVTTQGFYSAGDGGGANYQIVSSSGITVDGARYITLDNGLVAKLLIVGEANVKQFGAAGDGTTDDTAAIQAAIDAAIESGANIVTIPEGEYAVTDTIELPSNFALCGGTKSVLKYIGMGADADRPYANLSIVEAAGEENAPLTNITIDNITIDCTQQQFKGGPTLSDPENTNPQPASQGLRGIHITFATNVIVRNCKIVDLYGDGIRVSRSHSVIIDGNVLNDVGGGNVVSGGPTGYDNFGDGIVAFSSWDVKIINNSVINTRKYLSGASTGYICGRSGLEFEYGLQADGVNTPGYELFDDPSQANGLIMNNNYVYGYTKGIHLEAGVKCNITNNTVMHCNIGLMNTITGKTVIANNYFNQDNVGKAYQGGYDNYYGGVAISGYVNQDPARTNVEVNSNIFDGDTTGINIGRDYVSVNSNTFRGHGNTYGAIRNVKADIKGLSINGNQFYNCGVHLYHTRGANIANNVYSNTSNYCVLCEECDNTIVSGNEFNHRVTFTSATFNTSIIGNTFYAPSVIDASYTQMLTMAQTSRNALIEGNNINLVDNDDILFLNISGGVNTRIKNNNIRVSSSRTEKVIYLVNGGRDVDIESNVFIGCGYKATFITSNWDIYGFTLMNNILDEPTSYLYSQTGGGIGGQEKIEHNTGNLNIASNANSLTRLTNRFVQQGDVLKRYNPDNNNVIAYYCSQGGYYVTDSWTTNTAYTVNKLVKHNDYVYKCLTAGTATVSPANTTIGEDETGADGVKWVCVSKLATFRNIVIS